MRRAHPPGAWRRASGASWPERRHQGGWSWRETPRRVGVRGLGSEARLSFLPFLEGVGTPVGGLLGVLIPHLLPQFMLPRPGF